ncbi:MAG: thioredoxin [archaeon]
MQQVTKSDFESEVIQSEKPVIVDFWAAWCGPCKMMGPVFEELSGEFKGRLKFVKVNTEENPELSEQHEVRGIPCLIVFNSGKEAGRIVGFAAKDALKQKIEGILASI